MEIVNPVSGAWPFVPKPPWQKVPLLPPWLLEVESSMDFRAEANGLHAASLSR
jgi:hypothetical protein